MVVGTNYPNFTAEKIQKEHLEDDDGISDNTEVKNLPYYFIQSFPYKTKGKRKDDLIVFQSRLNEHYGLVMLLENPLNRSFTSDEMREKDRTLLWKETFLQIMHNPTLCLIMDISGNGFNDVVIVDEYLKDDGGFTQWHVGRVSWLENFGTDDGDWTRHDIGIYPGISSLIAGHFTTTYSSQILAYTKFENSNNADTCSIVIFTRPSDVYQSPRWLATVALENAFTLIYDCIIIQDKSNGLDKIIVSTPEGLFIAWYSEKSWHVRPVRTETLRSFIPKQLFVAKSSGRDYFFVAFEKAEHSQLVAYFRDSEIYESTIESIIWKRIVVEDFPNQVEAIQIICADFDNDGTDEILVALSCSGVYLYDLESDSVITKYKIHDSRIKYFSAGQFANKSITEFVSVHKAERDFISLFRSSFIASQVKTAIHDPKNTFYIPRTPFFTEEVDVIDSAGYIQSLVLLPPNATFSMITDGTNAVKVLYGSVAWINTGGDLIERHRISAELGCVASMLVDSREEYIRSSDHGAVFVRLRPSDRTTNSHLRAFNSLPKHFPHVNCTRDFSWIKACSQSWFTRDNRRELELYHLSAYEVRHIGENYDLANSKPLAYIHLWAAAPGISSGFHRRNLSNAEEYKYSVRACLSNPTSAGAVRFCQDILDQSSSCPIPSQLARATTLVLPTFYEHGPLWINVKTKDAKEPDDDEDLDAPEYFWHAWIAGKPIRQKQSPARNTPMKYDIWAAFDFQSCSINRSQQSKNTQCIIV